MLEVDRYGFDEIDRRLLLTIIEKYQGGPVGVNTLAASLAEEADAIEEIYEPFLIQIGFLDRRRVAAWQLTSPISISESSVRARAR